MKKLFTLASMALAFCLSSNSADFRSLTLVNKQLCTDDGNPIQLKGWSTHGCWFKYCYDDDQAFAKQKEKGANMARIAMYFRDGCSADEYWIKKCIDYCNNVGLYCMVDWHVLSGFDGDGSKGNPMDNVNEAKQFFSKISSYVKSKGYNHVLYEICNEPNHDVEGDVYEHGAGLKKDDGTQLPSVWGWIKDYCAQVLPAIKQNDPNSIVLVGTPQWDLGLLFPFLDPIDEMGMNVMYSFHYYAADQERYLGFLSGASAFIPVFVTEWGLSDHNGDTGCDTNSGDKLMSVCNGKNLGGKLISWANWSWSDEKKSNASFTRYPDGWSQSGNYIKNQLSQNKIEYSKSTAYDGKPQVFDGGNDFYLSLEKFDEGGQGNAYYDFDEDSVECSPIPCNSGHAGMSGVRQDDYVDIGYTDEDDLDNSYYNLGYIGQGEWVKYTIQVDHEGDYEFETYTSNFVDFNIMAIAVDGENGLVDENGNEINCAVELQPCNGGGKEKIDYNIWDWTTPVCPVAKDKKFRIRFKTPGEHKLAIVFMTSTSGLGSLKILGKPEIKEGVANTENNQVVNVWSSENGHINMVADNNSFVSVYNAQGGEVFSTEIKANISTKLNNSFEAGVYYVTVKNNKGVVTKKVFVK